MSRGVLLLMSLFAATTAFTGEIHKCRDATGKVSYTDRPCAGASQTEETRAVKDFGGGVAGITALCASDGPEWQAADQFDEAFFETLAPTQRAAMQATVLGLAYGGRRDTNTRWRRSRRGDVHFCTRLAEGQVLESVAGLNGEIVTFRGDSAKFVNDPNNPTAVLSRCSNAVTACFSPPATGLDSCVEGVPTCSGAPSAIDGAGCCPEQCKQAFRTRRAAGQDPMSALQDALFGDDSCVPGMNAALGR